MRIIQPRIDRFGNSYSINELGCKVNYVVFNTYAYLHLRKPISDSRADYSIPFWQSDWKATQRLQILLISYLAQETYIFLKKTLGMLPPGSGLQYLD